jgi:hypothetical protein
LFVEQTFVEKPIVTEPVVNKASESNTQV